ncbi:MAG: ATP-binding cassette domain-containing protein [Neisseriaceae bacterium]
MSLLSVKELSISFVNPEGTVDAVKHLSFNVEAGRTLGIVGESGSGKTQTGFAIMGLLERNAKRSGEVCFDGQDILHWSEKKMNRLRSRRIAMIFQDPMIALNPYLTIGRQLTEVLVFHQKLGQREAWVRSVAMLDAVKITQAKQRMQQYPHEISGGMRQRVMIAMALLCRPQLLIADEPTTALDVTVQAQLITLLKEIKQEFKMTMIFISHDLGVVASLCDEILVMRLGECVEYGSRDEVFLRPQHPYTQNLLDAIPRLPERIYEEKGRIRD